LTASARARLASHPGRDLVRSCETRPCLLGREAVRRDHGGAQGQPEAELAPPVLRSLPPALEQREGAPQIAGGLAGREAAFRRFRRACEPRDRPRRLMAAFEVRRELGRDLGGPRPEAALEALADLLMQEPAPPGRDPVVQDALVDGVREGVARGDHAVGPRLRIARAQEALRADQALARVLHGLEPYAECRRHRLRAELETGDARGLEHRDLELVEAEDLQLDELLEAARDVPLDRLQLRPYRHAAVAVCEPPTGHEEVHRRHEEERISLGVRVQESRERGRWGAAREAGAQIGLDARERKEAERELYAAALQRERAAHRVERAAVGDRLGGAVRAEKQKPRRLGALGEDRDEVDCARVRPVEILENEDERHVARELFDDLREDA